MATRPVSISYFISAAKCRDRDGVISDNRNGENGGAMAVAGMANRPQAGNRLAHLGIS